MSIRKSINLVLKLTLYDTNLCLCEFWLLQPARSALTLIQSTSKKQHHAKITKIPRNVKHLKQPVNIPDISGIIKYDFTKPANNDTAAL